MRMSGVVMFGAALALVSASSLADPRKFGTQWEGPDGSARITQLGLDVEGPQDPDPSLYRRPAFDWRRSNLQAGHYPKAAFSKGQQGTVRLQVDIAADGKPLSCRTVASSGVPDIDAHACPHVLRHTRFVPTLPRDGIAVPEVLLLSLEYGLGNIVVNAPAAGAPPAPRAHQVEPIEPIDRKMLGLSDIALPRDTGGFGVWLTVGADGAPTACLLTDPTLEDALDKRLCETLLARARFPAATAPTPRQFRGWIAARN